MDENLYIGEDHDLFYRLNVVPINLPPLRSRLEDLSDLVMHFLEKCKKEGLQSKNISELAIKELQKYNWPGNVRELENFIRRIVVLIPSLKIGKSDVEKNLKILGSSNTIFNENDPDDSSLSMSVEKHLKTFFKSHNDKLPSSGLYSRVLTEVERPLISLTLDATNGNQIKAAKLLGLNRNTLRKKIKELKINYLK